SRQERRRSVAGGAARRSDRGVSAVTESAGFRLVAIGCAEWEIGPVWPCLIDHSRDDRVLEQTGAVGGEFRAPWTDVLDPVGVEERRRGGAVGKREQLARRPAALGKIRLEPVVGDVQVLAP